MSVVLTKQSGQIGLVVLLVMVTVSVLGMSVAARSTRDVELSRQGQETVRTFSAAESAMEDILSHGNTYLGAVTSGQYTTDPNSVVNYTISQDSLVNSKLLQGEVAAVDLSTSVAGNVVSLEWGQSDNCADTPASLLVSVVNIVGTTSVVRYYSYAICDHSDGFTVVNTPGSTFKRRVDITLLAGDKRMRVTPVYNDTALLVQGSGWTMPTQGYTITSVAHNTQGRETQAVQLQRSINGAPSILDFAVVSGTTILK